MGEDGQEDGKLNYQERVTMIWIKKFKAMGSCALDCVEGRRGSAEDRVILVDMLYVGMVKGINQAMSNLPVKIISSNIRTLRDGDSNRGRMI